MSLPPFNPLGRPRRTWSAFEKRLEVMRALESGWLDGGGRVPTPEAISEAYTVGRERLDAKQPLPHVFPTEDGGLSLECADEEWFLEISPSGERLEVSE